MKIVDSEINVYENIKKSVNTHRVFWLIFIITVILDYITTLNFMYQDGVEQEKNSLVRWLATTMGIATGVFVAKSLQVFAVIAFSALSFRLSRAILLLVIMLNLLAVFINLL